MLKIINFIDQQIKVKVKNQYIEYTFIHLYKSYFKFPLLYQCIIFV